MLNFTQGIKREILSALPENDCCKRALFRALLEVCGSVNPACVEFTNENERLAEYFFSLAESLGLQPELDGAVYDARNGKDRISFCLRGERAARAYKIYSGINPYELKPCCAVAYVRGAFLGGGSCSLPRAGAKSGYHLEFVFSDEEKAENFCIVFESILFYTKTIKRGDKYVVYLKSREAVYESLSAIGVKSSLKELEKLLIAREENNFINRVENCMAGNADKSMTASAQQAHEIQKLKGSAAFSDLPESLKELAEERLNNPTLSLRELAAKTGVSKSCLNHRMRKLMEICRR
ncbi:MAG: DNA-binding protein WhiA [Clostridia bacterium]|nr:DNA-binding protein WhiA [Clostridia bacterium]